MSRDDRKHGQRYRYHRDLGYQHSMLGVADVIRSIGDSNLATGWPAQSPENVLTDLALITEISADRNAEAERPSSLRRQSHAFPQPGVENWQSRRCKDVGASGKAGAASISDCFPRTFGPTGLKFGTVLHLRQLSCKGTRAARTRGISCLAWMWSAHLLDKFTLQASGNGVSESGRRNQTTV